MAKSKLKINELTDKNDIINKIINQANSLNKKTKKFKEKGITEHGEYLKQVITTDLGVYNEQGSITKSKLVYNNLNTPMLKKILSTLHKLNNHKIFGTPTKYKKEVDNSLKGIQKYVEKHLTKKGYANDFIKDIINNKAYLSTLIDAFNEGVQGYGSDNVIEKLALNYDNTGFDNKELNKRLSNIEYAKNKIGELDEYQQAVDEVMRNKKMR